jgi:hypothetical protein
MIMTEAPTRTVNGRLLAELVPTVIITVELWVKVPFDTVTVKV